MGFQSAGGLPRSPSASLNKSIALGGGQFEKRNWYYFVQMKAVAKIRIRHEPDASGASRPRARGCMIPCFVRFHQRAARGNTVRTHWGKGGDSASQRCCSGLEQSGQSWRGTRMPIERSPLGFRLCFLGFQIKRPFLLEKTPDPFSPFIQELSVRPVAAIGLGFMVLDGHGSLTISHSTHRTACSS
jgi:hypothetical protein